MRFTQRKQFSETNVTSHVFNKFQIWIFFLNASAGHWKRCGGPDVARGPVVGPHCFRWKLISSFLLETLKISIPTVLFLYSVATLTLAEKTKQIFIWTKLSRNTTFVLHPAQESWVVHYPAACFFVDFIYWQNVRNLCFHNFLDF